MNIGIVGANGFVGRNLCSNFLHKNANVFAYYNANYSLIPNGCNIISLKSDLDQKLDCLIIAIGGHSSDHEEFVRQFDVIFMLLRKMTFKKLIFISSVAVYGQHDKTIFIDSCFNNPNLYGRSKLAQEFIISSVQDYLIIRPTYLYGDGMEKNSLIPIWIDDALNKKEILIYGNGERKQDYLHIDDLCRLCWQAILSNVKNRTLLVASGVSISNFDLATNIIDRVPNSELRFLGVDKSSSFVFDISLTKSLYDWRPEKNVIKWLHQSIFFK